MRLPFRTLRLLSVLTLVTMGSLASRCTSSLDSSETEAGRRAFEWGSELTELGPRPPGSAGIEKARAWIETKVKSAGLRLQTGPFTAKTPIGEIQMKNLFFTVAGSVGKQRNVLMAHYDSKRFVGFDFVGANDSATSVSLLLALVPEIQKLNLKDDVDVVFVDGEEALVRWTASDSLYGSRQFTKNLSKEKRVGSAMVLDMIGDGDLKLVNNVQSDPKLFAYVKEKLTEYGKESLLDSNPTSIEDDHLPLVEAGIPTLHLMDFTYGSAESPGKFWHTPEDTMDKISAQSLSIVGEIVLAVLKRVDGV